MCHKLLSQIKLYIESTISTKNRYAFYGEYEKANLFISKSTEVFAQNIFRMEDVNFYSTKEKFYN